MGFFLGSSDLKLQSSTDTEHGHEMISQNC